MGLLELLADRSHGPSPPPTVAASTLSHRTGQRFLFQPNNSEHMKNLIKPLESKCAEIIALGLNGETMDEAKSACIDHFQKLILHELSPETRAIMEQYINSTTPNP